MHVFIQIGKLRWRHAKWNVNQRHGKESFSDFKNENVNLKQGTTRFWLRALPRLKPGKITTSEKATN